jgi:serine-type D-Ala-D-Ala carboxypeptidase/endopeptidase
MKFKHLHAKLTPMTILCFATLFTVSGITRVNAAENVSPPIPDRHVVSKIVNPLISENEYVGIVVGIVTPVGSRVYGFGSSNLSRLQQPDGNSVFRLASISKVFTGILLADLVLQGVVRLDDPISKFLPKDVLGPHSPLSSITLLRLATHTSGFPKMVPHARRSAFPNEEPKPLTRDELYTFLRTFRPQTPPGGQFRYSNVGVALLGHILERASGQSYETLIEDHICRPLNMPDTRVEPTPNMTAHLAQGYNKQHRPVPPQHFDVGKGSGGLYSTADDMSRFIAANLGLINSPIVQTMLYAQQPQWKNPENPVAPMGLTWHIRDRNRFRLITKNGGVKGYQSFVAFIPEYRIGIVALANSSPQGRKLDQAAKRILLGMAGQGAIHSEKAFPGRSRAAQR